MKRHRSLMVTMCVWMCAATCLAQEGASTPGRKPDSTTGTIQGTVQSGDQPLGGVEVTLESTTDEGKVRKVVTGPDGSFEFLEVPPERWTLRAAKDGYMPTYTAATMFPGLTVPVVIRMPSEEEGGGTMIVIGRQGTSGTSVVMKRRKEEAGATTSAGRPEIRNMAASNAGDVAKRLPGVSVVGQFIYVRGLGDRYSQTLLNGANLPSPEPDKRAVPADLFPASLIESISISKTFVPEFPGEFSGGSVLIRTIDVPDKAFVTVGLDLKYRYGTTLRDFKTYHGGNTDALSFDDGTRALPGEVPNGNITGANLTDEQIQDIGRSFSNIWDVQTVTAPPDYKASISFGDRYGEKGGATFGYIGALNWGNKYQNIPDETRRYLQAISSSEAGINKDFVLNSSTFEAELSALLSMALEFNEAQKVGVRTLYTRGSTDETREQTGIDFGTQNPIKATRLRWIERSLLSVQPFGEHLLTGDTLLEWRASYALSQRDEPDNRQTLYNFDPVRHEYSIDTSQSAKRDYYQLDENIYDAGFDYSIPFAVLFDDKKKDVDVNRLAPLQKIKFGPSFLRRDRDFDARRFLFKPVGGTIPVDENGFPIDLFATTEEILQAQNINPKGFDVEETTRLTDSYQAEQTILAGYGLVDFRVLPDVRLQLGARVENSEQIVDTFTLTQPPRPTSTKLETTDVLPALNLAWEIYDRNELPDSEKLKTARRDSLVLRASGSQTVSRPEFRELAPFEFTDVQGGYPSQGNPNLQRAKIWNLDLALDWFVAEGELVSAGIFYKHLDSPIETVLIPQGSTALTTWQNADSGDLYGIEFELRKNLAFLKGDWFGEAPAVEKSAEGHDKTSPQADAQGKTTQPAQAADAGFGLKDISIVTNFSWMASEVQAAKSVKIGDAELSNLQTNSNRPLQGQSKYLFNIGLLLDSKPLDMSLSIFASTVGERISAVGASGLDDEIEQPRWSLDVTFLKRFKNGWSLKVTGENLLNDDYEYKQNDITTRHYRRGFAIGVGVSYSF